MDGTEPDWADELIRDQGHPTLATLISSFLLLLTTCSRPGATMATGAEAAGYLLGGITFSIALFWGIPYWITIRKASLGWKIGSFVAIAVLSILANLWVLGNANLKLEEGMKDQARQAQEIASGKRTKLEAGPDASPLQRIAVEIVNRNIDDLRAYHSALIAGGAERISMLQGLQHDAPELRDCGKFDRFAAQARANRGNLDTYVADARPKLDLEISNGTVSQRSVDQFLRGVADGKPSFERTWELQAQYAEAVAGICRILARKHWRPHQGQVAFTNDADMAATNDKLELIRALGVEQQRLKTELAGMQQVSR